MAHKSEIESLESQCDSVKDWVDLARKALAEPADPDYARELAGKAELECQDPGEYVQLAELFIKDLDDRDYAADLLEQAEDACFEAMEFAEVGCAYAALLDEKEKGSGLIRDAVDDASGTDLIQLADYAAKAGDSELSNSLLAKVTGDLKQVSDFQELAQKLVSAGNTDEARQVFKGAERYLDTVADTVAYAASFIELFDDRAQAGNLLENAIMDCQFPADYTALAAGYREVLDDADKIDELLDEAVESAMEGAEFVDVAYGFWNLKNDAENAAKYFTQALPDISDRSVLLEIASVAAAELKATELARECYDKAAGKITSASDLLKLAVETWEQLGDRAYSANLFQQAQDKMANAGDLVSLAESVMNTLGDQAMVMDVYRKAAGGIDSYTGLEKIFQSQRTTINDDDVSLEILERMQSLAESTSELVKVFTLADPIAGSEAFRRSVLKLADDATAGPADIQSVIDSVKSLAPDDETWLSGLEDRLRRWEANREKYAQLQKEEKQLSTALEFLRLAKRVVRDLDDRAYAGKLLEHARKLMSETDFDVSLWQTLLEMSARDLDDSDLAREVALAASEASPHFSSVYQLVRSVSGSMSADAGEEVNRRILTDWSGKMTDPADRIRLAKTILEVLQDHPWVQGILDENIDAGQLQLVELGLIAAEIDNPTQATDCYFNAIGKCTTTNQITQVIHRLKSAGVDSQLCQKLYDAGKACLEDVNEKLRWTEGILTNFADYDWARQEYDQLQPEVTGEAMMAAFSTSRRQRLERRL